MTSGEARAWVSSSYRFSSCSSRSNISTAQRGVLPTHHKTIAKLSDDEFAAALLFQHERGFERSDGALHLPVRWRLRGDPLQPQAGQREQLEDRRADPARMPPLQLARHPDHLV